MRHSSDRYHGLSSGFRRGSRVRKARSRFRRGYPAGRGGIRR